MLELDIVLAELGLRPELWRWTILSCNAGVFGGVREPAGASPVVLIARVVATSLALAHPHLLAHEVGLLLPLRLVGRGVQVPLVVNNFGLARYMLGKCKPNLF